MKIINNTSETSRYVNCCHIYPLTHTMYSETLFKSLISICFHCILTKNTHARLFNGAFIHNDRTKNVYKSTTKNYRKATTEKCRKKYVCPGTKENETKKIDIIQVTQDTNR